MQLSCVLPLAGGLALGLVAGGLVTFLLLSPAPTSLGNTDPGPPDHRDTARWAAVQSEEDTMQTSITMPTTSWPYFGVKLRKKLPIVTLK